ncbi:hypothetical protein GOBAR_AA03830 [Gossypium barbadense]|uniref:Uncharacterized protein n=1 Tax=Gossypium barbadense TaxID=3634 RepID=A0A2P5YMD5_GOSBA|nr:hypothetical protein GOBAR_AA03830 [Gossypium barbadense]
MVALYRGNRSNQNAPIQLFTELASVEPTEDPTPLGEEHGSQKSCLVVLISYVDNQSIVREININLNVASKTNVVGDDGYDSSDLSDHEVDNNSNPDVNEALDDIDDEGVKDDGNINVSSIEN